MTAFFERSEKDMIENAPIELFKTGGRQAWACRLRPAARVDEWIAKADEIIDLAGEVQRVAVRMLRLKDEYDVICGHADAGDATADPMAAYEAFRAARDIHRRRVREWIDAMIECLCEYDGQLNLDAIRAEGVTDEQILSAFQRMRFLSDPLAAQQTLTGLALKANQ